MTNTLHTFEKHARHDHSQEHAILFDRQGKVVVRRSGDFDSVGFLPAELEQARGGVLTHNHPRSLPISGADLTVASEYDLTLRAVAVDELDRMWDYTVKFPAQIPHIAKAFDRSVADAEAELANQDMTVRAWERESRHTALVRLAKSHGFNYSRVQINAPISETAKREVKRLRSLSDAEKVMQAEWLTPLTDSLGGVIQRHIDASGTIPMNALPIIRRQGAAIIQRSFLGVPTGDGALTPYIVHHGTVMPRSAYFRTLWKLMIGSATLAVDYHADLMRKYLPSEVIRHFESATISPFEDVKEIGSFNPLHLFTGPDGKQLLDRIWAAAGDMSARFDQFLTAVVAQQLTGSGINAELVDFMTPGKGSIFGGSGSYGAMRLARTENSAAYFRADSMAAQMDPFVETYSPYTAPEHMCCDNCDDIVAAGPYPVSDMLHLPPYHAHCILPGTEVHIPGKILAATKAFYVGECVEISTRSGRRLSVTPNHPILTTRGWVAAQLVAEGDQVLSAPCPDRILLGVGPDNHDMPSLIEDIFSAIKESGGMVAGGMPISPEDFHGDAGLFNGDIDIIYPDGALLDDIEASLAEPVSQLSFGEHNTGLPSLSSAGVMQFGAKRLPGPSDRVMSSLRHGLSSFWTHAGIHKRLTFRETSDGNIAPDEKCADSVAAYPVLTREFLDRFATEIIADDVIAVGRFKFSGHVYDLRVDPYELYISNGIITHNCICGVIWNLVDDPQSIVQRIIQNIKDSIDKMKGGIADRIGPLSKRFVSLLFGGKPQ